MIGFKLEFDTITDAIEFLRRLSQPSDVPAATKDDLNALESEIMSALSDATDALTTSVDAAIAALRAMVDSGASHAEVDAAVAAINDSTSKLDAAVAETTPTPTPTPPPA